MAFQSGSFTGINDALNLVSSWAVTNGWTQNMNTLEGGTNRRVHISKSINGTDVYFNLKAMFDDEEFQYTYSDVTGITLNGSTGFDAGDTCFEQAGGTVYGYTGTDSIGGCADSMPDTGGGYYFFATATTLTCVFETESDYSDYRMFTVGTVGGLPFYAASGGYRDDISTSYVQRSRYRTHSQTGDSYGACSFFDGTGWYTYFAGKGTTRTVQSGIASDYEFDCYYSLANELIRYSPDSPLGNAIVAPDQVMAVKDTANRGYPVGVVEGVNFINMKNYTDGQEIVIGSDTYVLFRFTHRPTSEEVTSGVAILK